MVSSLLGRETAGVWEGGVDPKNKFMGHSPQIPADLLPRSDKFFEQEEICFSIKKGANPLLFEYSSLYHKSLKMSS